MRRATEAHQPCGAGKSGQAKDEVAAGSCAGLGWTEGHGGVWASRRVCWRAAVELAGGSASRDSHWQYLVGRVQIGPTDVQQAAVARVPDCDCMCAECSAAAAGEQASSVGGDT